MALPTATPKLTPSEVEDEKRVAALAVINGTNWDDLTTPALTVVALTVEAAKRA